MSVDGSFEAYARQVIADYWSRPEELRYRLLNEVDGEQIGSVLDLGCGPGQELIPFLEKTDALCVGVDYGEPLSRIAFPFFEERGLDERVQLVRAAGESLPFADGCFDLVLCRVALPYMHSRRAIAEMARVLRPGGLLLLKVHGPRFFIRMLTERVSLLDPKQLAYPMVSLAHGLWHELTGHQATGGFWAGKEIFQTRRFLEREFRRNGLGIERTTVGSVPEAPSYKIRKMS